MQFFEPEGMSYTCKVKRSTHLELLCLRGYYDKMSYSVPTRSLLFGWSRISSSDRTFIRAGSTLDLTECAVGIHFRQLGMISSTPPTALVCTC